MKRVLLAACLGLAASACAEGYYGPSAYGGGRLAYYDDYYGPYYDGYWAHDGYYYYSLGRDRPFVRDEGRHFRRDHGGPGFRGVRGHHGDQTPGRPRDRDDRDDHERR
jgi:hypothetical protein